MTRATLRFFAAALPPILVAALLLIAGEWIIVHYKIPRYFLPRPTDIFTALVGPWRLPPEHGVDWSSARIHSWLISLGKTAAAAGMGFAASAVIGVLVAMLLSTSRWVERAFYPYTVFFQTVPVIAIAPLLTIWCGGYGFWPVTICAFIVSVFPVIANTLAGLTSVDPPLRDLFRFYGAGRITRLLKLQLPFALPSILTGLKIASGLAVIGAIVGEFVAGQVEENESLGIIITESKKVGRTDRVFAAILLASLLGLIMLWAVRLLSRLLLRRWHASESN